MLTTITQGAFREFAIAEIVRAEDHFKTTITTIKAKILNILDGVTSQALLKNCAKTLQKAQISAVLEKSL